MAFRLPRLPQDDEIVETTRRPTFKFQRWWQSVVSKIEAQETRQDDLLDAIIAAQQAAAAAADAATAASTAANNAQAAADAAQQAIDELAPTIPPSGTRTVTTDTGVSGTDSTLLADATAGPINIELPLAFSAPRTLTVKKIDASANAVTVITQGSDTINGGPSVSITTQFDSLSITNDSNTGWYA